MNCFERCDELRTKTVLKVNFLSINLLWNEYYFLMLNIYTFDWSNSFWEIKSFNFAKWFGCVPTAAIFPNEWRVEALLDCCPD